MCDIYQDKYVGSRFKKMLSMGDSKHWSEILFTLTGERTHDSTAITDYFAPLYEWLKTENKKRGYEVGW